MELLSKKMNLYNRKKLASSQITLEHDLNVPDHKPDVNHMIDSQADVLLLESKCADGKMEVSGEIQLRVLYTEEGEEHRICSLEYKIPFHEWIRLEEETSGENVQLKWEMEDKNLYLINSRKLGLRALLSFEVLSDSIHEISAAVEIHDANQPCVQTQEIDLLQLVVCKKDLFRIKQEFAVPAGKPDIQEIVWRQFSCRRVEILLRDGTMELTGEMQLFLLYNGKGEEQNRQWMEVSAPIRGSIECRDCTSQMIGDIAWKLNPVQVEVKADEDGEERVLQIEGSIGLEMKLYTEEKTKLLSDLYFPGRKLQMMASEENYEELVGHNVSKCRIQEALRIEKNQSRILQICCSDGILRLDDQVLEEDGVKLEGALAVSVLYVSANDESPLVHMHGLLPFTHRAKISGLDSNCEISVHGNMEQLSVSMSDSEEVEIRAILNLDLFVVKKKQIQCITQVTEGETDWELIHSLPGMCGYFVQPGDTLWEIAKRYATTPEAIMEINQMEKEEVIPGNPLILVKMIPSM